MWIVIISVQEDEKMAKQIDDETMENVCILAKLSLTEEEKEKLNVLGGSSWIRNQIRMARIGEIQ